MKNNNQNNNDRNRFVYTDEEMPGIIVTKQAQESNLNDSVSSQKQNETKMKFIQFVNLMHKSRDHENLFDKIIDLLMNELCISAGLKKYRIVECEIYYDDKKDHQDPYLYGHEKQSKKLEWYFHYSGIDLTLGNDCNIKGGILIRSVLDLESNTLFSGPLKSSNIILNNAHVGSFQSTIENKPLCLESFNYSETEAGFEKTIRIGLDQGKILKERTNQQEEDSYFYRKKYRYILKPYVGIKKYSDDALKNEKRLANIINTAKK